MAISFDLLLFACFSMLIQVPDGVRLHMVAVYLTELGSVVDDQVQELNINDINACIILVLIFIQ